jgi:hypothetical protein
LSRFFALLSFSNACLSSGGMMMDMPKFVHYFIDGPFRHENLCCVYEVRLKGQLRLVHQMASMEGGSQAVDSIFWRREHLSAPVL